MSSASSSTSFPFSGLSDLEASTPSPNSDDCTHLLHLPKTLVYIDLVDAEADVLNSVFDKFGCRGFLGLCLACVDEPQGTLSSKVVDWQKEFVPARERSSAVEAFISSQGAMSGVCVSETLVSTCPRLAQHLFTFSLAGLRAILSIPVTGGYIAHIVERPSIIFRPLSHAPGFTVTAAHSKGNIPTTKEWNTVWSAWDLITLHMIPQEMLYQKPIDLRHKCLFYIGHIPTFLDLLINKSIGGGASEPEYFRNIFERGIDPDVDDPDHCHNHSEVPEKDEDWPTLDAVVEFRNRVRARLGRLYNELQTGERRLTRNIARTLVMALEHEGFHIETLLYMLIQCAGTGTLPPPGITPPPWKILAQQWDANPAPTCETVTLGPATISLGHADSEGDDALESIAENIDGHIFGWDNESPERRYEIAAFRVEWRPVSNLEYEFFWRKNGSPKSGLPGNWVMEDGEVKIRTLYGPVPMRVAQSWPVLTSYDQLSTYARSKGGRLPTEFELRLFLDAYDVGYEGGANVGFRNWHPIPATMGTTENGGKGSNGGVWEWTSTLFDTHEGLSPTNLFTGYSTDFFDTKHHVVLGASYATIPRIAGRRTVRNFYQHNYPYAWVGGRVVYDL